MPEERLPWGQTIVSGLQHGVAMAGGTIIAPLIMGFDPNRALLFRAWHSDLLCRCRRTCTELLGLELLLYRGRHCRNRIFRPWAKPQPRCGAGRHHCSGCVYGIKALIVMQSGVGWVERLMPPVVTGAVVAAIGLNLAPVAVKSVSHSQFDTWIGLLTVLIIGLIAVAAPGMWRRLPIIFGAIGGYLLYLLFANGFGWERPIDFTALAAAPWMGLPNSPVRPSTRMQCS